MRTDSTHGSTAQIGMLSLVDKIQMFPHWHVCKSCIMISLECPLWFLRLKSAHSYIDPNFQMGQQTGSPLVGVDGVVDESSSKSLSTINICILAVDMPTPLGRYLNCHFRILLHQRSSSISFKML